MLTYRCPWCREKLETVPLSQFRWYEWPMLLLLARPRRCGHCFNCFIRPII